MADNYRTFLINFATDPQIGGVDYQINTASLIFPQDQQWYSEDPYTEPVASSKFTDNAYWGSYSTAAVATQGVISLTGIGNMQLQWKFPWSSPNIENNLTIDSTEYTASLNMLEHQNPQTVTWLIVISKAQFVGNEAYEAFVTERKNRLSACFA